VTQRCSGPTVLEARRGSDRWQLILASLIKPQHEFPDFAGTCFSEASLSRDDAKAALLEDAVRCDVVGGKACVERARRINGQERV
jgi:hypothetical protein